VSRTAVAVEGKLGIISMELSITDFIIS
jgi:hypothetical protein